MPHGFFTNVMNKQTLSISTILTLAQREHHFLHMPDLQIPAAFHQTKPHQDFHYGATVFRMNDETGGLHAKPSLTNPASCLAHG